jgi:hypothetical protein
MKFKLKLILLCAAFNAFAASPSITSRLFVLSIGVNNFNDNFTQQKYSHNDAKIISEVFTYYGQFSFNEVIKFELTGKDASRDSIKKAIRNISERIGKDDCFVFFFAGRSVEGYPGADSSKEKTILFRSFIPNKNGHETDPSDWEVVQKESMSLPMLKNLLDLIQAKRQLIITESGSGSRFAEYLARTFIDKDIFNAQNNDRNRVFITTQEYGMEIKAKMRSVILPVCDTCERCEYAPVNDSIQGGPIPFFLSHLKQMNADVFDLFNSKSVERKFYFLEELNKCIFTMPYINFIYERDMLKTVSSVAESIEGGKFRGSELVDDKRENQTGTPKSPNRKNYALLIGTDIYKASCWRKLTNPVYDVRKIDTLLRNLYGFETELLIDTSRKAILNALNRYSKMEFDSSSQLLIFIAGHGFFDENNLGMIVCNDSEDPKTDEFYDSYISHSRLRDNINAIGCRHILVVLDVCFGGTFDQSLMKIQMFNNTDEIYQDEYKQNQLTSAEFALRLMGHKTRLYITSGGKEYVPDGLPHHHSPFAAGFIQALETKGNADKILNCGEIRSKVFRLQPEPRGGSFDPAADGDFVFVSLK